MTTRCVHKTIASTSLHVISIAVLISIVLLVSACSIPTTYEENLLRNIDESYQTNRTYTQDDLVSGGVPKGGINEDIGIPALLNPQYESIGQASIWMEPNEDVLVFSQIDPVHIYPLHILTWHEIVNDNIDGTSFMITYCPLCLTGVAFSRIVDGQELTFGISGKLLNSNLVMYDEETDTYWPQASGRAIIGPLTGAQLEQLPLGITTWQEAKQAHPNAQVLSRPDFDRPYGVDPYGNYFDSDQIYFRVDKQSDALQPKDVVYGLSINGLHKAYKEEDILTLSNNQVITDVIDNVTITIQRKADGTVSFTANDEELAPLRSFWFAWFAFHPKTSVYGQEQ